MRTSNETLLTVVLCFAAVLACNRKSGSPGSDGGCGDGCANVVSIAHCAADGDCASGSCRDGICCDRSCAGPCQACSLGYTGAPDGLCAPVKAGLDPHDDCQDQTATDPCAGDGQCDGVGRCRKTPSGRQCADAACVDLHTFVSAGICNGTGSCAVGATIDCGAYVCSGAAGCAKPCASDAACPAGSACLSGTCQARRSNGEVCVANVECVSGFCSPDQVCCDQPCVGVCMSCSGQATGQPDGRCAPVREGLDLRDDCSIDPPESCGSNGSCDGMGQCELYGLGTVCSPPHCDSGQFVSARTCSAGVCAPAAQQACGLAACDPTSGCKQTCAADGDCIENTYCQGASHACAAQKANGVACTGGHECLSGYCVDGVCCNNQCSGLCVSCVAVENGQQVDGTCGDVVDGTDPENECAADGTACGLDGFCGRGRCRVAPATTVCAAAQCVNAPSNTSATFTPPARCDGQGACAPATSQLCPGSVICLSDHECRPSTCSTSADCINGSYCASGNCAVQQPIGATCSANEQCTSDSCSSDSVCCASSCSLACQGCTFASTGSPNGACAPRLSNATAVCNGACANGYGLCSTGLSCQATTWTFDSDPMSSNQPFDWVPDDMSAVHWSLQQNHTPGGGGSLNVVAGTPWSAAPGVVFCTNDPGYVDSQTSLDLGGKTLDAWVLFDGPSPTASCLFEILHLNGSFDDIGALVFVSGQPDVWRELTATVPLVNPDVFKLAIRCQVGDPDVGWNGSIYIDDVSIR